ncbi:MAG: M23 family metallopeptidase [Myxococcales bacterium]|nr:M23 family metallopeptidase [Myxococcales bacterium]
MSARLSVALVLLSVGCSWAATASGAPFTYEPAGELVAGSGKGLKTTKIYAPSMRYPIMNAPSYPNSQVWGVGGSQGPTGGQCDVKNFSYPWHDNYCETRTWSMPLCPAGKGHQGQDIRPATCENKKHPTAATEDGTITSIGTYSVYLKGASGTTYRYLHMDPATLTVKTGQKVSKGQKLGLVSNAFGGTPTTVHLHFDIEQFVAGVGTVFVSPYNSLVQSYTNLIGVTDPCAGKDCDDSNVCTKDSCSAGTCSHTPVSSPCDDGNACTLNDACQNGKCAAGGEKPCDDGKLCTTDSCNAGKCVFAANTKVCDDTNLCTGGDACANGACQSGKAKACSDGVACTQDLCEKGICKNPPLAGTCDDKDPCTADTCTASGCQHQAQGCDDANPCTQDACSGAVCTHKDISGLCDDGNACTSGDTCVKASCVGISSNCDDDNACTADACQNGACSNDPTAGACDDGDACSEGDYCALGLCLSGVAKDCDDGLDCTVDTCGDGQCVHAGDIQPVEKVCQSKELLEVYDECGAGPTLQECPPDKPCGSGQCGGKPDPLAKADAAGSSADDTKGTIGDGGASADTLSASDGQGGATTDLDAASGLSADSIGNSTSVGASGAAGPASSGCSSRRAAAPDWLTVAALVAILACQRWRHRRNNVETLTI